MLPIDGKQGKQGMSEKPSPHSEAGQRTADWMRISFWRREAIRKEITPWLITTQTLPIMMISNYQYPIPRNIDLACGQKFPASSISPKRVTVPPTNLAFLHTDTRTENQEHEHRCNLAFSNIRDKCFCSCLEKWKGKFFLSGFRLPGDKFAADYINYTVLMRTVFLSKLSTISSRAFNFRWRITMCVIAL